LLKKLKTYYKSSSLVQDNIILFFSTMGLNAFAFLFHFYMGRVLGPGDYGVLGVLLSLILFFIIAVFTIQTSMAKFTSEFKAKKQYNKINFLLRVSLKKLTIYGLIVMIIFIAISPLLSKFLHIPTILLITLSPSILFINLLAINRGILQGLQKFKSLGFNLISEGIIKFFGGVLLVTIGLKVYGAIGAIILSVIIAFILSLKQLKRILNNNIKKFNTKPVYKYSLPVLVILLSLTAFYTIDIFLVKHFFSNKEAGLYVATSLIGKILFFGSLSISQVMFPKITNLYAKKKPHKHVLYKSLLIISLLIFPAIIIYFLFPKLIVFILYGKQFLEIAPLIGWFGITMGLFSLNYLISFYFISIYRFKILYLLFIFNLIEIILIYLFHNTLLQVIQIFFTLMLIIFIILMGLTIKMKDG